MRRRRRGRSGTVLFVTGLVALVIVATAVPAATFTTATVDREGVVQVGDDTNAIVGVTVHEPVEIGNTDEVITATNNAETTLSVTVTLVTSDTGQLVVDGQAIGERAEFEVVPGTAQTVEIEVPSDCDLLGEPVQLSVDTETETFESSKDRVSQISDTAPEECGGDGPGPPGGDPGPPGDGGPPSGAGGE